MAVNIAPAISATVEDVNSTTVYLTTGRTAGNSFTFIKYHSSALATMRATPQDGVAMDESLYIIRNGDRTGYGTSYTFDNVENNTFTFSCEDERGCASKMDYTVNMIDYIRLTCNINSSRPDANGDMRLSCKGTFFNDSFGAVNNSLLVEYVYSGTDGSSGSGEMIVTTSGNTYYAYADLSGLDYQATYSFTAIAEDELERVLSTANNVKSVPVFHWGENDFAFEVPVNFNGSGTNTVKGDLRLKGDGNYGNTLYFGDGSYCSISEPSDDNMKIKANTLNFDATNLQVKGVPISGTWTPELDSSSVNVYNDQYGWYLKLGKIVVIGWFVRANIDTGSHSIQVAILGAPFIPDVSAYGGGVAVNIYTPAGYNFAGWCIDSYGEITARLQPCNGTSAGNLQMSSQAGYPMDGGTITLSGTICFTT